MSLPGTAEIWRVTARMEEVTMDFLNRLFAIFPSTKTYFPGYDRTLGSADVKAQGKMVADVLTQAVNHLEDVAGSLSK